MLKDARPDSVSCCMYIDSGVVLLDFRIHRVSYGIAGAAVAEQQLVVGVLVGLLWWCFIIKIKICSSCEIEYFVETYLCKLCVIL